MSTRPVRSKAAASGRVRHSSTSRDGDDRQRRAKLRVSRTVEIIQPSESCAINVPLARFPSAAPFSLVARWLSGLLWIWELESTSGRGDRLPSRCDLAAGDIDQLISQGLVRRVPRAEGKLPARGTRGYALTVAGTALVRQLALAMAHVLESEGRASSAEHPYWDRLRRELRLGHIVVKRFRRPASNQELILSAFEEQQWPERIDDPLPRSLRVDPRHRLHETIKSLNHCLESPVLHFGGDGTGLGVRWSSRMECLGR